MPNIKKIILVLIILAVISFGLCWSIPLLHESETDDALVAASFAADIATVFAVIFLVFEVRSSSRSQNLEGANYLFDLLNDAKARERRRMIYDAYKGKRDLGEHETDAEKIVVDLDRVSIMVKEGLFPKKIAFRMYSTVAIQCWKALKNFVEAQRKLRNQPSWAGDFEWFCNESLRYKKKEVS